jgi:hypothetical protein
LNDFGILTVGDDGMLTAAISSVVDESVDIVEEGGVVAKNIDSFSLRLLLLWRSCCKWRFGRQNGGKPPESFREGCATETYPSTTIERARSKLNANPPYSNPFDNEYLFVFSIVMQFYDKDHFNATIAINSIADDFEMLKFSNPGVSKKTLLFLVISNHEVLYVTIKRITSKK